MQAVCSNDKAAVSEWAALQSFTILNEYEITAEPNNPALGQVDGAGTYTHVEEVTITATPCTGAEFIEWTENGVVVMDGDEPASAGYVFTALNDLNLVAHFIVADPGVPGILFLADHLVTAGETLCWSATQTIYTAGDDDFIVMEDAQLDLIAGENIVMMRLATSMCKYSILWDSCFWSPR